MGKFQNISLLRIVVESADLIITGHHIEPVSRHRPMNVNRARLANVCEVAKTRDGRRADLRGRNQNANDAKGQ